MAIVLSGAKVRQDKQGMMKRESYWLLGTG
jgi:hypothetical protein